MTVEEWDIVLANCGVFYGWIIDATTSRIIRAPQAAFRLRQKPAPLTHVLDVAAIETPSTEVPSIVTPAKVDVSQPARGYKSGVPNFRVNDASSIEVTAYEHE